MQTINIEENRYRFCEILRSVKRDGADVEGLIYKLEHSDFFIAPASTKFHLNVAGGLCQHSLNVYDNLTKLIEKFELNFDSQAVIIVSLLHDIDKMGKYELQNRNVKQYCDNGSKKDEDGRRFNWVVEKHYGVKDAEKRFVYGHHGQNSEYIVNTYIPLNLEESAAIVNHMGSCGEYEPFDSTPIFNRYTLASLLHVADFISTFVTETRNEQVD